MRWMLQCRAQWLLVLAIVFAISSVQPVFAQLNSNTTNVTLTATLVEALTVSAIPSAVNFTLVNGTAADGSAPVAMTTTWVLSPTRTSVKLYGNFSSSTAALTDGGGNNIPSADVLGQVSTGSPTSYTAFTQTGPFGAASASLLLFNQTITALNLTGTRTDNLNLRIDLSSLTLPAGVYVGTLHLQAQAL
jgi:hypothetical protein